MRYALGLAALIGLVGAGCHHRLREGEPPPIRVAHAVHEFLHHAAPVGAVVVVERAHMHGPGCGHYWYNGQWYLHQGHVHGPGCGHCYHSGVWVLAGAVAVEKAHVHDANCGHYYHEGHWYMMHGHVHGAG